MGDFARRKIVYPEIQTDNSADGYPFPCFTYDDGQSVVLNSGYILACATVDPKYVLGILNSSLGNLLIKQYVIRLGERQFRMLAQFMNRIPVRMPSADEEREVVRLVDGVLSGGGDDAEALLNRCVCELYGLTTDEAEILDNFVRRT